MGGAYRRRWAPTLTAELASLAGRMLWYLDSRRPLLFLPQEHTRRVQSLGVARICRHSSKAVHPIPTDDGSFVVWLPGAQPGRQETLYGWPTRPGRTCPLRCWIPPVCAIPLWNLRRGAGLLSRRQVGQPMCPIPTMRSGAAAWTVATPFNSPFPRWRPIFLAGRRMVPKSHS
jgi:hypothetical protein